MNELKVCPFCGGKADFDFDFVGKYEKTMHNITCENCEARTGNFHGKLDAADSWNDRVKFSTVKGKQLISEEAITYLHDNHPEAYEGFYERIDK
jgi:Lar family restriction alleviation protein